VIWSFHTKTETQEYQDRDQNQDYRTLKIGSRDQDSSLENSTTTRSAIRDVQCSDKLRASSVALTRSEQRGSAWHGLAQTSDRQRINLVIDRARRLAYCSPDLRTFDELCDIADDELFGNAVLWSNDVLHTLLPPLSTASQRYNPGAAEGPRN